MAPKTPPMIAPISRTAFSFDGAEAEGDRVVSGIEEVGVDAIVIVGAAVTEVTMKERTIATTACLSGREGYRETEFILNRPNWRWSFETRSVSTSNLRQTMFLRSGREMGDTVFYISSILTARCV
jgi:hypothetical protein